MTFQTNSTSDSDHAPRSVDPRNLDPLSDEALVQRMVRKDEAALGLLYDRWAGYIFTVAVKIVHSEDAEEVLEDTFWQAWRQADRFDPERGKVSTWLSTIARSRALERRRRQNRGLQVDELTPADQRRHPDNGNGPLGETILREREQRVADAIDELPETQRETVRLAYFGGLSQSEIAKKLGQPIGTIKTRARLASAKLKESLSAMSEAVV